MDYEKFRDEVRKQVIEAKANEQAKGLFEKYKKEIRGKNVKKEVNKKFKKIVGKMSNIFDKKITWKPIMKKEKPSTIVFSTQPQRSKYFKQEYEEARWV